MNRKKMNHIIYLLKQLKNDDRIHRYDEDVTKALKKELGDEYGVYIRRIDAYPNGTAYYKMYVDK